MIPVAVEGGQRPFDGIDMMHRKLINKTQFESSVVHTYVPT